MNDAPKTKPDKDAKSEREDRLNAALRANLQKRKQQTRKRAVNSADAETAPDTKSDEG